MIRTIAQDWMLWSALGFAALGGYTAGRDVRPQPAVLVLESDKGRSPEFVRLNLEFGADGRATRYGWTSDGLRWVERDGRWFAQAYDEGEEL